MGHDQTFKDLLSPFFLDFRRLCGRRGVLPRQIAA